MVDCAFVSLRIQWDGLGDVTAKYDFKCSFPKLRHQDIFSQILPVTLQISHYLPRFLMKDLHACTFKQIKMSELCSLF